MIKEDQTMKIERFEGDKGPGFVVKCSNGDLKIWGFNTSGQRLLMVWNEDVTKLLYKKTF